MDKMTSVLAYMLLPSPSFRQILWDTLYVLYCVYYMVGGSDGGYKRKVREREDSLEEYTYKIYKIDSKIVRQ